MPRDLNDRPDRPDHGHPGRGGPPPRRTTARLAAVAGLSVTAALAAVGIAVAAPAPTPSDRVADCADQAAAQAVLEAARLPASERDAFIRRAVEAARARCAALATTTTSPTTTSSTTTSPTTTTSTTTSTTSPTTTRPRQYEVVATGVIGTGPQTLEANCDPGDQVVTYRYQVGNPTGTNPSRRVSASSNGRGVRLTYEVTGTVADPRTSLTVVCRRAA